jgi:DNA (cytosine-5)-methyltransferase 1
MIYGSVCSGIEAATVAWRHLGWRAAWYAEIDPFASAVLAYRFPEVHNFGDFTQIAADAAGAIDLLVGGTPCQSFSLAGRRLGLDDPRGNLTMEFLRLAARARPRWVVWENVPGVLSIDGGRTFGTVLRTLADLGYGLAYRVLDAQFFGVPQRRRRVFVVGCTGGWQAAAAVLFERESLRRDLAPRRQSGAEIAGTLEARASTGGFDPGAHGAASGHLIAARIVGQSVSAKWAKRGSGPSGSEYHNLVAHTLRGEGFDATEDGSGKGIPLAVAFSCKDYGADATEDVTPTLRAMGHNGSHPNAGGQLAAVIFESRFARNGRGAPDVVAPPLKAQSGTSGRGDGAPLLASWVAVRRLTPRECERLQGVPDDWTLIPGYSIKLRPHEIVEMAEYLGISIERAELYGATPDGPRYKAIGNSMAVPVMRWIGTRIDHVDAVLQRTA